MNETLEFSYENDPSTSRFCTRAERVPDGWIMEFCFGEMYALVKNECEYFTEMWVRLSPESNLLASGYITPAHVCDVLNFLPAQVEVPCLVDPLVVEAEVNYE